MSLLIKKSKAARLGLDSGKERGSLTNMAIHRTLGGGAAAASLPFPPPKKKISVHTVMRGMSQWGKLEWKHLRRCLRLHEEFLDRCVGSWIVRHHRTAVHREQLGDQISQDSCPQRTAGTPDIIG
jgi:hypothetical protein